MPDINKPFANLTDELSQILKAGLVACLKECREAHELSRNFLVKNNAGTVKDLKEKISEQRLAISQIREEIKNTSHNIHEKIETLPKKQQDQIILPEAPEISDLISSSPQ